MNINKATIVGRVCHTPELKKTKTDKAVLQTSIATNYSWKDLNGVKQEKAQFHNVVMWGKLAEIFAQYVVKGQEVYIDGRIETRQYEAKDGSKRYATEIIAENMQMGAKPGEGGGKPLPEDDGSAPRDREEISQKSGEIANDEVAKSSKLDTEEEEIKIEDVPF